MIAIKLLRITKSNIPRKEKKKKKRSANTKLKRRNWICNLARTIVIKDLSAKETIMSTDIIKVIKKRDIISIERMRRNPRKGIIVTIVVVQDPKSLMMPTIMTGSTQRSTMTKLSLKLHRLTMIKNQVNLSDTS